MPSSRFRKKIYETRIGFAGRMVRENVTEPVSDLSSEGSIKEGAMKVDRGAIRFGKFLRKKRKNKRSRASLGIIGLNLRKRGRR